MPFPFATVEEAIEEFRQGRQIVLVDDEDRENEGDLALPAEKITPEAINFMAKHGRGLICLALTEDRCDELNLPPMSPVNTSALRHGLHRIHRRASRHHHRHQRRRSRHHDSHGHRSGHAPRRSWPPRPRLPACARGAAACWCARGRRKPPWISRASRGLYPAGVICEIMNDDGSMARLPQLAEFCREHGLKLLTVAELIRYRMRHERYVRRVAEGVLPTRYGDFRMIVFASDVDREQHIALVRGDLVRPAAAGARAFALPHRRRLRLHDLRLL